MAEPDNEFLSSVSSVVKPLERLKRPALWLVVLMIAATVLFYLLDIHAGSDPPYLAFAFNVVFVYFSSALIAVIAARSFVRTGNWSVLWLGGGSYAFGFTLLLSGLMIAPSTANAAVTAHNIGALFAATLHFMGAFLAFNTAPPQERRAGRRSTILQVYLAVFVFISFIAIVSSRGLLPAFFITGIGGTPIRQMILATTGILFLVAGLLFYRRYQRTGSDLLYWYSLGLLLTALGMAGLMMETMMGTPLNWIGRFAQYVGGVYLLVAALVTLKQAKATRSSPEEALADLLTQTERRLREQEAQYRRIVETANEGIWISDPEGRTVFVNRKTTEMLGYTHEEMMGKTGPAFLAPGQEELLTRIRTQLAAGEKMQYEARFHRKDGGDLWSLATATGIFDEKGRHLGNLFMHTDITERKQVERQREELLTRVDQLATNLTEDNRLLQALMENTGANLAYLDRQFKFVMVNSTYAKSCGYTADELIGKDHFALFPNEENEDIFKRVRDTGAVVTFHDKPFVFADQPWRGVTYWDWTMSPVKDSSGRVQGLVLSLIDTTERKKTEDIIHGLEERYRNLFMESPYGTVTVDAATMKFIDFNDKAASQLGYTRDEFAGLSLPDIESAETAEQVKAHLARISREDGDFFITRYRTKQGEIRDVEVTVRVVQLASKPNLLCIFHDVTRRKEREARINYLASFPEMNPNPVLETDLEGRVVYANPAAQAAFPDLMAAGSAHPYLADFAAIAAGLQQGDGQSVTREVMVGESCHLQVLQLIREKGAIRIYGRDITQRKRAETELAAHRNRLEELVKERTAEMAKTNINLKKEVTVRAKAEEKLKATETSFRSAIASNVDGMVIIDKEGRVLFANPAAEALLGNGKEGLVGSLFSFPVITEEFMEIDIARDNGATVAAEMRMAPTRWEDRDVYLTMLRDITQRKENEKRERVQQDFYKLFMEAPTQQEYLQKAADLLREFTGCRCVGIRGADKRGNIPYLAQVGFSPEFLASENYLSLKNDQCVCIRVVAGSIEPQDAPVMTPNGSFCSNDTFAFVKALTPEQAARFRGVCIKTGFQTVAVVPIHYAGQSLGAIHIADERPGALSAAAIQLVESIAPLIGEAINRFRTEQELRENQARLSEAERIGRLGNWVWDIPTNELTWSEEVYRIFGREKTLEQPQAFEMTFDMFLSFVHPDDRELVQNTVNETLGEGKPYDIEHRIILPDGSVRTVHELGVVYSDKSGKPVRMVGTVHDMTVHKRVEEELRTLSRRIVETQENERRAIAREMHDVLGQSLTVLKLMLDKAAHAPPEALTPALQEAQDVVNEVVQRVRNISMELRPSMLDDLGLLPTLVWFCDRYSSQTKIRIDFTHDGLDRDFPVEVSTAAYRIIQEALTNATRYAKVEEVSINAWADNNNLFVTIEDRGAGFDPAQLAAGTSSGISGMKERALAVGGKLIVDSAPGKGTTITAELPISTGGKMMQKEI